MPPNCPRCGAPLGAEALQTRTCRFCQSIIEPIAEGPASPVQDPAAMRMAAMAELMTAAAAARAQAPARRRSGCTPGCLLTLIVIVLIIAGAVVAIFVYSPYSPYSPIQGQPNGNGPPPPAQRR